MIANVATARARVADHGLGLVRVDMVNLITMAMLWYRRWAIFRRG
jgi:hypothetical protein